MDGECALSAWKRHARCPAIECQDGLSDAARELVLSVRNGHGGVVPFDGQEALHLCVATRVLPARTGPIRNVIAPR